MRASPTRSSLTPVLLSGVVVFNVLTLAFLLLFAACNRLTTDDFCFLGKVRSLGVVGCAAWYWQHWTGRWASSSLIALVTALSGPSCRLWGYSLVTLLAFTLSLWWLLNVLARRVLSVRPSPLVMANLAFFLVGQLFFATFERGQAWVWLSGSATYLWPLSLLFVALALLLHPKPSPIQLLTASLLFGLIPGCNETLAFVSLLGLGAAAGFFGLRARFRIRVLRRDPAFLKAFWPLLLCLAGSSLVVFAPGTHARQATVARGDMGNVLAYTLHALTFFPHHRLPWLAMPALFGYAVGRLYPLAEAQDARSTARLLPLLAAGVVVATFLSVLPAALADRSGPPLRAWLQITVVFVGACFAAGFILANSMGKVSRDGPMFSALLAVGLLANALLAAYFLKQQYPIVTRYAASYDARLRFLYAKQAQGTTGLAIMDNLPDSGWLITADTSTDPQSWLNQCLKDGLALGFDVRCRR
ncbi:MAG TPA: DUF6056 family protein [Chthonomonadaceae bacterium]|nr:DUF6056 family protein [Chthonomonadaceae bacterium]